MYPKKLNNNKLPKEIQICDDTRKLRKISINLLLNYPFYSVDKFDFLNKLYLYLSCIKNVQVNIIQNFAVLKSAPCKMLQKKFIIIMK